MVEKKQRVFLRKSAVVDKLPAVSDMNYGEVLVNYASGNGKAFLATKKNDDTVAKFMEKSYNDATYCTQTAASEFAALALSNAMTYTDSLSGNVTTALANHTHNASAITGGTLDLARIPTGTTNTTVARGDHSHSSVASATTATSAKTSVSATTASDSDKLDGKHASDFALTGHTHNASAITGGTLDLARIPTGTTSSTVAVGNHNHSGYLTTATTYAKSTTVAGIACSADTLDGKHASEFSLTGHSHNSVASATTATSATTSVSATTSSDSDKLDGKHASDFALTGHTHNASAITGGTLAFALIPTGTTSSTVAVGNHSHSGVYQPAGSYLSASTKYAASDSVGGKALSATVATSATTAVSAKTSVSAITALSVPNVVNNANNYIITDNGGDEIIVIGKSDHIVGFSDTDGSVTVTINPENGEITAEGDIIINNGEDEPISLKTIGSYFVYNVDGELETSYPIYSTEYIKTDGAIEGTSIYGENVHASTKVVVGDVDTEGNIYVYGHGGPVDEEGEAQQWSLIDKVLNHTHVASAITAGTFNIARIPTGTTSTTVARGDHNHSGVYASTAHTHNASAITGGTFALARIPTGTTSTNVARGDHNHNTLYLSKTFSANVVTEIERLDEKIDDNEEVVSASINNLASSISGKSDNGHKHVAGDVTGGTFNIARIPTGTTSTTVARGDHSHSGYALTGHTHPLFDYVYYDEDMDEIEVNTYLNCADDVSISTLYSDNISVRNEGNLSIGEPAFAGGDILIYGHGGPTEEGEYVGWSLIDKVTGNTASINNIDKDITNSTAAAYLIGSSTYATGKLSSSTLRRCGNVYMEGGIVYSTSDENLKDFKGDIKVDLDKLAGIPKKYFTWKDRDIYAMQIGTSAQEVQKLYPEIVTKDPEGNLGVCYERLSVVALAAVDKLHEENKELRKENDELKERLRKIEEKLGL